jgi:hypothetical protein
MYGAQVRGWREALHARRQDRGGQHAQRAPPSGPRPGRRPHRHGPYSLPLLISLPLVRERKRREVLERVDQRNRKERADCDGEEVRTVSLDRSPRFPTLVSVLSR